MAIDAAARLNGPTLGPALGGSAAAVATREQIVGLACGAEAAGLDSLEVGDHIQWHRPIFESTTLMATWAGATSQPLVRAGNALRVSGDSREWAVSVSFALEFVQMSVQHDPEEDLQAEMPSSG